MAVVKELPEVEKPQPEIEKCGIQDEEQETVVPLSRKITKAARGYPSMDELHVEPRRDTPLPKHRHLKELVKRKDQSISKIPLFVYNQKDNVWFRANLPLGTVSEGRMHVAAYNIGSYPKNSTIFEIHTAKGFVSLRIARTDAKDYEELKQQSDKNRLVPYHRNIIGIRDTFIHNQSHFCVVFPYMNLGSLRHIMASEFSDGLPEECIAVALKQVLKGLAFIHKNGQVHREISAGHIFVDTFLNIRLAFAATVFEDEEDLKVPRSSSTQTQDSFCKWAAAPEVYNSENNEYTPKADIWLIGITALELAYGNKFRITNREALESLVENINKTNRLPMIDPGESPDQEEFIFPSRPNIQTKRDFTWYFKEMTKKCLAKEPANRPTADELLKTKMMKLKKGLWHFYKEVIETYERKQQ